MYKRQIKDSGDKELKEMAEAELEQLKDDLEQVTQRLKVLLIPKDPNDEKSVVVEIRACLLYTSY